MRRDAACGLVLFLGVLGGCASAPPAAPADGRVWTEVTAETWGTEVLDPWVHARSPGDAHAAVVSPAASIVEGRPGGEGLGPSATRSEARAERSLLTEHFRLTSDLDDAALEGYERDLERAWAAYEASFGRAPEGPRIEARILASDRAYAALLAERHEPWLPGFYDPSSRTLSVHVAGDGRPAGTADRSVLCHEVFHAFADRALPELPPWLREGLATREAFDLLGVGPGAVEWRRALELELRRRRDDLPPYLGRIGWGELFSASDAVFHDTAEQARLGARTNREASGYVLSWSLLALAKAEPASAAARLVAATLERLRVGADPRVAFSEEALDAEWRRFVTGYLRATDRAVERPLDRPAALALRERDVRAALEARLVQARRAHDRALEVAARVRGDDLADAAAAVAACYELGDREVGAAIARRAGVRSFDAAGDVASIDCFFSSASHGLVVTVRRLPGVVGPLALAFPPGTYGAAPAAFVDRDRVGRVQDLALLRAPVVALTDREDAVTVSVPVACASFASLGPCDRQAMTLARSEPGSRVDRLLVVLCSGEPRPEPEAQLALWVAANDVTRTSFRDRGGERGLVRTFGGEPVLPGSARGAARLLLEGAIDPRDQRFFSP
jgi:hypothetical protein